MQQANMDLKKQNGGPLLDQSGGYLYLKGLVLMLFAAAFAGLPFLFTAPLLQVVWVSMPVWFFVIAASLSFVGLMAMDLAPMALVYLSMVLLVVFYQGIFIKKFNMFYSGLLASLLSAVVTVTTTQQWLKVKGMDLGALVNQYTLELIGVLEKNMGSKGIDAGVIEAQVPSMVIVFLLFSLFLSVLLEGSLRNLFGFRLSREQVINRAVDKNTMLLFKLPNYLIWIAMFSFLLSFIKGIDQSVQNLAANLFNVLVVFYFFQGLAVVEAFFRFLRAGVFIKFLFYFLFVLQLFVVVAAIGFADYWLDFRDRMKRKKPFGLGKKEL